MAQPQPAAYGSTSKGSSSRAPGWQGSIQQDDDFEDEELGLQPEPTGPKSVSPALLAVVLGLFVLCGTFSTVLSKVLFQCQAVGLDGQLKHFGKPLFQNTGMFAGMSLCYVVFELHRRINTIKASAEQKPLVAKRLEEARKKTDYRVYYVVIVPAVCDFLATYMMNVGLLWINASVWQMLRGSIVLFAALVRWIWLGRQIRSFQWVAIGIVMTALGIIGFSCIMNEGAQEETSQLVATNAQRALGIFLVLAAQLVQAVQTVVEEHLLHDINASDMQIVGLEGIWGLVLCVAVAMPFAQNISYPGLHEDTWDTLEMLKNSRQVIILYTLYVIVILVYNMMAMKTTMYLDSIKRNILDTARTIFIWTFLTFVHYNIDPSYGEDWGPWSLVQLAGFVTLVTGIFSFYEILKLPGFDYTPIVEAKPIRPPVGHSPYMSPKI